MMPNEAKRPPYDIFLSFHNDTRSTFTGNLYYALRHKRFRIFMDDPDDHGLGGKEISPSVIEAIENSRIFIVILSIKYASSVLCLEELVKMVECTKKSDKKQVIWPIYYDVRPTDVRHQRNSYDEAFNKHERRFYPNDLDKLQKWRSALTLVSGMAGWLYGTGYEYDLIEKIVQSTIQTLHRYDIFLSFTGEDTRHSFTGFLYNALRKEGFKAFMDDEGLIGGSQIPATLIQAIEMSRLSIIVFSENYGYSTWCLDELATIIECMKTKNQLVWPIFYKVEQSDVSNQTNSYGDAMAAHEIRFGKDSDKVQKWRSTLSEVANLEGWHFKTGYEYEFIQKIVEMAIDTENHFYAPSPSSSVIQKIVEMAIDKE